MQTVTYATDADLISDVGSSAKMVGLGGIEGFSDSAAVVFENPAGLNQLRRGSVSLFTTTFMGEVMYDAISAGFNLPIGRVGIGYMDATVGDIPIVVTQNALKQNEISGSFSYKSSLIKFSYQFSPLKNVSVGASLIQYRASFYNISADGINAEIGTLIDLSPFTLSLVGRNIIGGSFMTYTGDGKVGREPLVPQIICAGKYHWQDFNLMAQVKNTLSNSLLSLGIEYSPSFFSMLQIVGGYKNYEVNKWVQTGYTMGVNLKIRGTQFQYAYEKTDYLLDDNKHYFSVSVDW